MPGGVSSGLAVAGSVRCARCLDPRLTDAGLLAGFGVDSRGLWWPWFSASISGPVLSAHRSKGNVDVCVTNAVDLATNTPANPIHFAPDQLANLLSMLLRYDY